ncbi:hypothetical protein BDW22DRAFT_417322 [Trametopsis cervina]|nr:hypothetical protein BDW22DRAFT_417322 [Trametopsis cervina]
MFAFNALVAALGAASALAMPLKRADVEITDEVVLNFALTLEHLENAFYSQGLAKLDAAAFAKAGFAPWVRNRFVQIGQHEATHVQELKSLLGANATQPCNYTFPYTDAKSFAALSAALEGTGTSAYLGAAQLITNKDILTAAGSILAVEARHDAWVASAIEKEAPFNGPNDTPLPVNGVFSIASQFITSCPSTNPALPVSPLPAFKITTPNPTANKTVSLQFSLPSSASALNVAWFYGLSVVHTAIDTSKNTTVVPPNLAGTAYAAVVSTDSASPSNQTLLTGVAIVEFPNPSAPES